MNNEREFSWDDTIEREGTEFVVLPEGDYNFTVSKVEKARFNGSANLPACNQAKVELTIHAPQRDVTVFHNLFLHSKTEGLLSAFFGAIGHKKKGEPLRMNWNAVVGAKGRCVLEHNKYTSKGEERVNNQVKRFYHHDEYMKHIGGQASVSQQPPFPGVQTSGQQSGGWSAGQF